MPVQITQKISIEPISFAIGGLGAVAVGATADEYHQSSGDDNQISESYIRDLSPPVRAVVRFCAGGLIYVLADTLQQAVVQPRIPAIAGAITAMCFSNTSQKKVFFASTAGMAAFCQVAEMLFQNYMK